MRSSTGSTPLARLKLRYSEDQPRDDHGRFGSGDGGSSSGASSDGNPKGDVAAFETAVTKTLADGQSASVRADQVASLVTSWKGSSDPINMSNLHVDGADHGNLFDYSATDLPREAMPVIPDDAEHLQEFAAKLSDQGIEARVETGIDPTELHATQNQLDGVKVSGMVSWAKGDPSGFADHYLVVSKDGDVLDGHHRWAAGAVASLDEPPSVTMNVLRVNTDIDTLLNAGWKYNEEQGIQSKPFGQRSIFQALDQKPTTPCPDPAKPYLWFGGKWLLLATDTSDGVSRKLDVPTKQVVNTKINSQPKE